MVRPIRTPIAKSRIGKMGVDVLFCMIFKCILAVFPYSAKLVHSPTLNKKRSVQGEGGTLNGAKLLLHISTWFTSSCANL